jgi:branched-chain amino acid aminotransferase
MDLVSVNGRITTAGEAAVSPLDRGFLYGDSVYETLRTYDAVPFRLGPHLDRLRRSAEALGIAHGRAVVDPGEAVTALLAADRAAGDDAAREGHVERALRVILTRGVGGIGYDPAGCGPPTLVVHVRPLPALPVGSHREGVDIAIVPVTRNARSALDPAIKSSNLLNNYLAWEAGRRLGVFEPILLNEEGQITEGASSNLFLARDGRLRTPDLDTGVLAGITRAAVIEAARGGGLEVTEAPLVPSDLRDADEAFLTSTLKGVLPVRRADGWPVRDGRPGPLTRRVMDLFDALVQAETKAGSAPGSMRR